MTGCEAQHCMGACTGAAAWSASQLHTCTGTTVGVCSTTAAATATAAAVAQQHASREPDAAARES